MSLIKALFNVVTGEKVANPSFKKSKLNNGLTDNHADISNQKSHQMNAVIDEFKQSKINLTDGNDDIMSDYNSIVEGPTSQFNELSLLTRDPFFPSPLKLIEFPNKKSFLFGSRPPLVAREDEKLRNLIGTVDFTRITNRIILGGLFWKNPSSKKHRRNNIDDGAAFLKARFKDNFMIWNLAKGLSQCEYDFSSFNEQIVSYKLSRSSDCTITSLLDIVRSIDAWLSLDFSNVAIVHCVKGTYSALVIACWLIYAGFFDDGMEALEFVCARRRIRLNIGVYRYAMYFANIIATNGEVPNKGGTLMERLSVHGFNNIKRKRRGKIGIEVFEKGTSVFKQYGSVIEEYMPPNSSSLIPITNCMFQYQNTLIFDLMFYKSVILRNEVRITLNVYDGQGEVIEKLFQFSFHTGYMPPGVIRILKKDIDWYVSSQELEKFSLEIDLRTADDSNNVCSIKYESLLEREILACLGRIVANHVINPDLRLLNDLISRGHGTVISSFALQRSRNNFEAANKILRRLARSADFLESLDSSYNPIEEEEVKRLNDSSLYKISTGSSMSKLSRFESNASLGNKSVNISQESLSSSVSDATHRNREPPEILERQSSLQMSHERSDVDHIHISDRPNPPRQIKQENSGNMAAERSEAYEISQNKPPKSSSRMLARYSDQIERPEKSSARFQDRKSDSNQTIEGGAFTTKWADEWINTINNLLASREKMTSRDFSSFNLSVSDEDKTPTVKRPPIHKYTTGDRLGTIDGFPHNEKAKNCVNGSNDKSSGQKSERVSNSSLIPQNLSAFSTDLNELSGTIANLADSSELMPVPLGNSEVPSLTISNLRKNDFDSVANQTSPVMISNDSLEVNSKGKLMDSRDRSASLSNSRRRSSSPPSAPPPAPAPPPEAPPPPGAPPPPPPMAPGLNIARENKKRVKNKLHWSVIRNIEDGSVWNQLDYDVNLDVQKFEELFCVVPGAKNKNTNIVQKAQFNSFLDTRRSNNILIGLSRFTRRGLSPEMLVGAISRMDEDLMDADDLVTYQALLPTFEERKLIRNALSSPANPAIPFAPAESFLIEVAKIEDLPFQVLAFVFKLQLKFEADELIERLDTATNLCFELRSSVRLRKLLKMVLELGNLTNYEYGAGNGSFRPWMGNNARAVGFKIDGLARLRDVKSADGKWSLMTFLVDMIYKTYPELLGLENSFSSLPVVKSYDFREFYIQYLTMDATEKKLKGHQFQDKVFQNILNDFLVKSNDIIRGLNQKFTTFTQTWLDTLTYFGEDPSEHYNIMQDHNDPAKEGKKSPIYMFVSLDLFFQSFKDAVSSARAEIEKKKNRELSESQNLKKQALLNSASSLDIELNTPTRSDSSTSIASSATVKKSDSSDDVFEEAELEKVRRKMAHRLSSQFEGNQIIVDTNSRGNTESILANAASHKFGLDDPELVLRRHSIMSSQAKKRLKLGRNIQEVRKSINLDSLKFEK